MYIDMVWYVYVSLMINLHWGAGFFEMKVVLHPFFCIILKINKSTELWTLGGKILENCWNLS